MEENKFTINIEPAIGISNEEWYLGCIRDMAKELGKFEEVKIIGQERIDALNAKNKEQRIANWEYYRKFYTDRLSIKVEYGDITPEEYDKELTDINKTIDEAIDRL